MNKRTAAYRTAVYPRVGGGTKHSACTSRPSWGLSPRVRGNPAAPQKKGATTRSIPACAGEPAPTWSMGPRTRVYPRVCGGTTEATVVLRISMGLSPRVRGNR